MSANSKATLRTVNEMALGSVLSRMGEPSIANGRKTKWVEQVEYTIWMAQSRKVTCEREGFMGSVSQQLLIVVVMKESLNQVSRKASGLTTISLRVVPTRDSG